jgi:hypothetical protein
MRPLRLAIQERSKSFQPLRDKRAFALVRAAQRVYQRVDAQFGHRLDNKSADFCGGGNTCETAVLIVLFPHDKTALFKTVHDSRGGAVRKSEVRAEFLQAHAIRGMHYGSHRALLWSSQVPAREFDFEWAPYYPANRAEVAIDFMRQV